MAFGKYNANKYGVSLDLNLPKGRELAWKFIKWADIVTESFRPGTMTKWGLDYESVKKVRPDIIYFSTSMQGQTGPFATYGGLGPMMTGVSGFGEISGWPDRLPSPPYGAYTDYVCQRFGSTAIIAALDYRQRTGKGVWIEQSQLESCIHFVAPLVLDYQVNGRIATRDGNRLPYAAPHGVFPCQGDDRWVAIAVFNDEQWQALCRVSGNPAWVNHPKFGTLAARKQNEDELEALVAQWTAKHDAPQIETSLQAAGVPASAVAKTSDLFKDPQLAHRKFWVKLEHPEMGKPSFQAQADFILSKTPREITRPSPCLGEHNAYVYKEFLGMTDDEIADGIVDGSITTEMSLE
jgi:crotonobetainyl-CoA:carnitine CoA-transferase CaiB-like acyl-CoA transferase